MSGDIEDKPQPLIEHLIELRTRLIWALGAFFLAFIVCFYFAKPLPPAQFTDLLTSATRPEPSRRHAGVSLLP